MDCLLVYKFVEVGGILGSIGSKLLNCNYLHTVMNGIFGILFKVRRARRVFILNMRRYQRDLSMGHYKPLDMFGMGLKYEWWWESLRMTLGYTHHVILEVIGGFIIIIDDKIMVLCSGHIEYLNNVYIHVKAVNPLGKYKEKGIIDPRLPARLRKKREKRR